MLELPPALPRGGKGTDYISQAGSLTGSTVNGDLGSDTILFTTGVAGSSSVFGGSVTHTSEDSADSLAFSSTIESGFVQGNAGADTLYLLGAVSSNSSIFGGAGSDYVTVGSTFSQSEIVGNLGGDTLLFVGAVDQSTVYGGSISQTTNDGADSMDFTAGATSTFVQLNAGNDTLDFSTGSAQSTVKVVQVTTPSSLVALSLMSRAIRGADTLDLDRLNKLHLRCW